MTICTMNQDYSRTQVTAEHLLQCWTRFPKHFSIGPDSQNTYFSVGPDSQNTSVLDPIPRILQCWT